MCGLFYAIFLYPRLFVSKTFYIQNKGTQLILRITANCWPVNLGNPSHMKILLLVGLIVLNGLFAMSEIALVAAKNSRLKRLAEKHRSAQIALELKENPTRFLSTIQIGITVIGLLSGIVGEATLSAPLAVQLALWGLDPTQANILSTAVVVVGITYFAIVVGITYFAIVVGELVPNRFA